ncbi:UbiA-domain-containing protein [Annulohypoxylon stygium]|nr:UbiA-domain-containing protein [Annulohypoxylon stygium]
MSSPRASPRAPTPSSFGGTEGTSINFFPDLPPSDPTTGFLSVLPKSWVPYAQLMCLDQPANLCAYYFPYIIGLVYAACVAPETPSPASILKLAAILLPFNIILRGAVCTWNSTVDQHFDRCVSWTRHRPVARGAVSTTQANIFYLVQILLLYLFHKLALLPPVATRHTIATLIYFFNYSLVKRMTRNMRFLLSMAFGWAIFSATAMVHENPFPYDKATIALFGANVLWTITYDTVYAHQDTEDDAEADRTMTLVRVLSAGQVGLLWLCGMWAGFGLLYFIGTVGGVAGVMAHYIYDVDLRLLESCGGWFHRQFWIVGAAFVAGFVGEYLLRLQYI